MKFVIIVGIPNDLLEEIKGYIKIVSNQDMFIFLPDDEGNVDKGELSSFILGEHDLSGVIIAPYEMITQESNLFSNLMQIHSNLTLRYFLTEKQENLEDLGERWKKISSYALGKSPYEAHRLRWVEEIAKSILVHYLT